MPPLLTAIAITALALGLLWAGAALGWWLVDRCVDPLLERCREAGEGERILQAAALNEAAFRQRRLQRDRHRLQKRLHDLDGRPFLLDAEAFESFRERCRRELGLSAPCSWSELRRHWRRCSLAWHPDRGGDPQLWLRRQRAYEALKLLREAPHEGWMSTDAAVRPPARPLLRSVRWRGPWRRWR